MSIGFDRAKESFLVELAAQGKASNTIKNYRCDLGELREYCSLTQCDFLSLGVAELENYVLYLRKKGLKTNSCRRKLMTARKFIRFLSGKVDVATIGIEKHIPPEKVEKPPRLVDLEVIQEVLELQPETDIGLRNRALIHVLLDTGMLVTEALALRTSDLHGFSLKVGGKRARMVMISKETAHSIALLKDKLHQHFKGKTFLFHGYSKAGPYPERMTARGVELLFKAWGRQLGQKNLRPRVLRHMYIVSELQKGRTEGQIMGMVGLKTPYSFRVYRQIQDSNHIRERKASGVSGQLENTGKK